MPNQTNINLLASPGFSIPINSPKKNHATKDKDVKALIAMMAGTNPYSINE